MALTCTHLTLDTPSPTLPFAPKSAPRGRGTERMLQDTTLAPTGLAPNGGPRTRILSKITGTLGALRSVIQWQRAQLGIRGKRVPASAKRKASQVFRPGVVPRQVELSWQAACRRMRKTALAFREDLLLHEFVASAPDPSLPLIRPLPTLVDCMSLYDSLCALGKRYARYEERTRIDKWKSKMDQAWLDRPKEVYQWIQNEYQPPLVMLLDPDTSQPTANIPRMDEILHASWDQVMRKYADTPEPDVHAFAQKYDKFLIKGVQMQSTPITGSRLAQRLRKMGVHTATGLDGWCVSDLLLLPTCLLDMLSEILFLVEATGTWPRVLARGYVSLIPKGEGMMPMQQRPLSVLSQIYRVWAGIRLEECMVWQELWIHPHAYGFRKKRGATDAAAFISMLIELHKLMKAVLHGFGLDYIKCFDLIPQSIVLHIALTQGMDLGTHRALSGMYRTLTRCFKIMGCLASFFDATNGILQGCPLSVILINLLTSVWKRVLDAQRQGIKVAVQALPPSDQPAQALHFILTALGYADDTYGFAAGSNTLTPLLDCTTDWLEDTGQGVNAKKSVGFSSDARHPVKAALQGVPFPISSEFKSLGAGVRTTDATCSGPLIKKRISRACSLLDRVHGAQGNFERRCDIISTMITATGLHAAEIVPLQPRDLLPFETKVMQTIWGRSRPGRAKEIFFTLLCKGHRIAPTLVLKYHRILWLSQLCRTRGAGQITAQAIWEMTSFHKGSGPYGRAMSTAQECGWVATQGWWGWKVPGRQEPLLLYGDKNTVKHEVREQLRSQMLDSLVQRRPRLFAGAHYTTCRRLVQPSIASFATELQRSLLRGILSGATWTALRAYQRGMRATSTCPYCGNAPENEEHIFWQCSAWSTVRDTHLPGIRMAAAQITGLPLMDQWPPCLRLCGLAPELDTASVKSGTALAFMTALHNMLVAVLQARKLRDTQSPMLFMGSSLSQQLRQYPYHQLVGPLPRPEDKGLLLLRTPKKVEWQWEMPFLADLLRWLRELHWAPEPGTVTFLELALDFEEFAQRTLPHAPQAKFKGTTLSLQERGRVLRLAMANAQRLVTKGHLHPARVVTRCSSLVPLGGPALCGLNCRPYFTCRSAMSMHVQQLAAYCERTWATKVGLHRIHKLRPYTHRPRRTTQEVEEHRLQRTLQGNLQLGLAPSSEQTTFAKGGGGLPLLCS